MHLNSAANDRSPLHSHRWLLGQEQLCAIFDSTDTFIYGDKLKFTPALSQPLLPILFNDDLLRTLPQQIIQHSLQRSLY